MADSDRALRPAPGPPPGGLDDRRLYKWLLALWRAFRAMRDREDEGADGSFTDNGGREITVRRGRIVEIEDS